MFAFAAVGDAPEPCRTGPVIPLLGAWIMSAEMYLKRAAQCHRLGAVVQHARLRSAFFDLAECWLLLATERMQASPSVTLDLLPGEPAISPSTAERSLHH
jgi:hypothetical protein